MKRFFTTLNLIIISSIILFAQQGSGRGGNMPQIGVLSGKVIDKSSNTPVEYASIILYSMRDSSLVSGTITNATGGFLLKDLPMGRFYLDIKFLGYDHLIKHNIKINPKQTTLNLGKILLNVSAEEIGEVSIVADRTQIQYKLDKKVINVGQDVSAAGGSAVDVLEKSPSIQTDIDGNVTLRGSSSFTVFIDGKPTVLDANDALQQIPASEIQNIELITNPSAKYDPDGVAGIINIVMKKNRTSGISGIVNASIGTNHKYKGDFLVNFRADKFNWFIGGNYRDYTFLGGNESVRETYLPTQTNYLNYSGTRDMIRGGDGIKTGIDINLSTNQSLSLSANIGTFEFV
ncbi:MAG: carboxypeptidase regulatory-like domain-containing protein, partial [Bacteroidales bacterium]|nr:carboxypeptidase regulatory-like domain-containing protein [Bacteroidales bacterium]